MVVLVAGGNYFYNVAICRSHEAVELHGGNDAVTTSVMIEEERQKKLEEVLKWTENQLFEKVDITSKDGLKLKVFTYSIQNQMAKL
jgi:hypothetical protein